MGEQVSRPKQVLRAPTHSSCRALPEDVRVRPGKPAERAGSQRRAAPRRLRRGHSAQKLQGGVISERGGSPRTGSGVPKGGSLARGWRKPQRPGPREREAWKDRGPRGGAQGAGPTRRCGLEGQGRHRAGSG